MRVLLRDLSPGQQYAMSFRSNDGAGNVSDWSQVQRFTTTADQMPPANVVNLSWFDSGPSFIAQWDKVTTNNDGPPATPLKDFRCYHVKVTNGVTTAEYWPIAERFEFTQSMNTAQFGTFQNSLTISVTAVDLTHNESPVPATATANPLNPPTPSAPTVGNYLGLLTVNWDGKASDGTAMASNFDHAEVHVSTTNLFTPTAATQAGTLLQMDGTAKIVLSGFTYGTPYFVRLIAVNKMGKKSGPSAQGSGTPTTITGLDITNGQIAAEQINWVSTKIPGGNAYYQTSPPTGGVYGSQDIWYDTSNGYAPSKWNGTTWVVATDVGFIAGQKIIAGTITADKVGTNFLIAAKAKIGQAWIDSADITSINAGIITAGVMKSAATNTYGGVAQPAWSLDLNGNAVLNTATVYGSITLGQSGNTSAQNVAAAIQSYNYVAGSAGWAIKGDGSVEFVNGTFRGALYTGFSGQRRTQITNGSISQVDFYSSTGTQSYVRAYTESSNGRETIQLAMPIANTNTLWNRLNINSVEYSTWRSGTLELMFRDGFKLFNTTTNNDATTVTREVINIDNNMVMTFYPTNDVVWSWGNSMGMSQIQFFSNQSAGNYTSVALGLFNAQGNGARIQYYYNAADGGPERVEFREWNNANWINARSNLFENMSDVRLKTNIRDADTSGMLDEVMGMKVKRYFRTRDDGTILPWAHDEIGFIAQEVPAQVLSGGKLQVEEYNAINLYALVVQLYGAFQEGMTELRGDIAALQKGKSK